MKKLLLILLCLPLIGFGQYKIKSIKKTSADLVDKFGEIEKKTIFLNHYILYNKDGTVDKIYGTKGESYHPDPEGAKERQRVEDSITLADYKVWISEYEKRTNKSNTLPLYNQFEFETGRLFRLSLVLPTRPGMTTFKYENGKLSRKDRYTFLDKYYYYDPDPDKVRLLDSEIFKYNNKGDTISISTYKKDGSLVNKVLFKYNNQDQKIEKKRVSDQTIDFVTYYIYNSRGDLIEEKKVEDWDKTQKEEWKKKWYNGKLIEHIYTYTDLESGGADIEISKYEYNKLDSLVSEIELVYERENNISILDSSSCDTIRYIYDKIGNKAIFSKTNKYKYNRNIFEEIERDYFSYIEDFNLLREGSAEAGYSVIKYDKGKIVESSVIFLSNSIRYKCLKDSTWSESWGEYICVDSVIRTKFLPPAGVSASYADYSGDITKYKYNTDGKLIEESEYSFNQDLLPLSYENQIKPYERVNFPKIPDNLTLGQRTTYEYDQYGNLIRKILFEGDLLIPKQMWETIYEYYK